MMHFLKKNERPGFTHLLPMLVIGLVLGVFIGRVWGATATESKLGTAATNTVQITGIGQSPPSGTADEVEFRQFWEVWQLLKEKFYRQPIDESQLFYGALEGLAAGLDDPYTSYFPPAEAEEFQTALSGKFSGIGAEIGIKEERVSVVAPLPDTPAERAGLKAGDIILSVDGEDTVGWTIEEAVSRIRGERGTVVVLEIYRPSTEEAPFEVSITRDEIQIQSVRLVERDDRITHLVITHFNGDTRDAFSEAVDDILAQDPEGIVLDMRNNPGGFLDTALFVAGEWVGDEIVVKERRQGVIFGELRGSGRNRLKGIPTVVLVNEGSASASEIVAGALQDHGAATIVGVKTFGKGSVQDYINLDDGSAVKITIAEWLTPSERVINEQGLVPDVVIEPTEEDYEAGKDVQLEKAIEVLTGGGEPAESAE
jgi:carboxyl-terminal processing protease